MAIQRVGIQFDFNANTKQAETNLNALEKTMMRLENRMRSMGAPKDPDAPSRSGKQQIQTQGNLSKFGASTIDLKSPIRQTEILTESIRKGKIGWGEYGRAVKQNTAIVTQQLAQQTGSISNVQRAGKGFAATFTPNSMLTGISGLEMATTKMKTFGASTKAVSQNVIDLGKNLAFSARQMTVSLTMPLAIMGGLAIKQFTDIDKQLTDIAKVYDTSADSVDMSVGRIRSSMKDLASELSRTQGAEIKDTLNIAQYYAQQGKVGEELRESTVQASRLMVLGDVDQNDAQKTITTLTSVVGASVKEIAKYVDYLNKVEDSTQLTMQDFAQTLPTIAPLVKTFIPDDPDALMSTSASMMEASRRAGFEPKESMNAWKSMYGSFVRPAEKTEEKFGDLTGKYDGERKSLRGLVSEKGGDPVQILSELSKITKDWSEVDRGELMTQLTGKWQLSRGLGIMQAMDPNVGDNGIAMKRMGDINQELVKNPEALADNSHRQMDLIRNSAHTQLKQLKQEVTLMFADMGEKIFLPVMEALQRVLGLAKITYEAISSLPGPLKDILSVLAQVGFVAGPILAAIAATKILGGFAGKVAANFADTAANVGRIGGSILGIKMKGSGKLESKEESIAKIQDKNAGSIDRQMTDLIQAENKARMQSVALAEEKNVKTRESIQLQREYNRAMTGSITPTPVGTPVKDPKKDLKKYQASLQTPSQNWPMAIQAKDIGPESFRRHAGKIGAPATKVSGVGLAGGKVFGSGHKMGHVGLLPKTSATSAGLSTNAESHIQKELDKVNAGIAVRRDQIEQEEKAIRKLKKNSVSPEAKAERATMGRRQRNKSENAVLAPIAERKESIESIKGGSTNPTTNRSTSPRPLNVDEHYGVGINPDEKKAAPAAAPVAKKTQKVKKLRGKKRFQNESPDVESKVTPAAKRPNIALPDYTRPLDANEHYGVGIDPDDKKAPPVVAPVAKKQEPTKKATPVAKPKEAVKPVKPPVKSTPGWGGVMIPDDMSIYPKEDVKPAKKEDVKPAKKREFNPPPPAVYDPTPGGFGGILPTDKARPLPAKPKEEVKPAKAAPATERPNMVVPDYTRPLDVNEHYGVQADEKKTTPTPVPGPEAKKTQDAKPAEKKAALAAKPGTGRPTLGIDYGRPAGANEKVTDPANVPAAKQVKSQAAVKGDTLTDLEAQKAALLKASNGNAIEQAKITSKLKASQSFEADVSQKHAKAVAEQTKGLTWRDKVKDASKMATAKFGRDKSAIEKQERAWSKNTLRGGDGEYFRGHTTPKDVHTAKKSDQFKEIKTALKQNLSDSKFDPDDKIKGNSFEIGDLIKENEEKRQELYDSISDGYEEVYEEVHGKKPSMAETADFANQEVEKTGLPTTAALQRETDIYSEQMLARADKIEARQQKITANAGEWSEKITSTAVGFGLIGTMATQALGIQNGLVDAALMFANGIGAVGMVAPELAEKITGAFANVGATIADKFSPENVGSVLGEKLGDTMGTAVSEKMSTAFSKIGALSSKAMPYLAAIAMAGLAVKAAWDFHRKDSLKYVENLKEANKSVELHAELLGYVRNEAKPEEDMTYEEATTKRADAYRDNKDGRSNFVKEIGSVEGHPTVGITGVLNKEAIRILGDGGDEADVRSMVDAALEAAGIQDEQVIAGVKLHFKDFETTVDTAASDKTMEDLRKSFSGEETSRTFGDKVEDVAARFDPTKLKNWTRTSSDDDVYKVENNLSGEAEARVEQWSTDMTAAINSADTSEQKDAIAKKWIENLDAARQAAEDSGDEEAIGTSIGMRRDFFDNALKNLSSGNRAASELLSDDSLKKLKDNMIVLQSVIGGKNQADFDTPKESADQYAEALKQIEGAHGPLNDKEKAALHNSIAYAGGMERIADDADLAKVKLGEFEKAVVVADGKLDNAGGFKTAQEAMDAFNAGDLSAEDLESQAKQVEGFAMAIDSVPGEFSRRWNFEVTSDQESVDAMVANLKTATQAGMEYASGEAASQFQDRQDAAFEQIQAEGDAAMASMDAKQKASEKAFEARGKALEAQFDAESKALDKQHDAEQKVYDKQQAQRDKDFEKRQRGDQRVYDKQEQAKEKEFSKMQEAEAELFEDSWDSKEDAISGYYDNAIKAIEKQGEAEEKLEQTRQRNAERERKRREYLANMANANIDINVAVAGGNLDEAARLSNSAASSATDYYQDQIDTESGYAMEDNNAVRSAKTESLGNAQSASSEAFGEIREDASEGFGDSQDLASEKNEEVLQNERDLYEEKKTLESEQYEEQKALEAERFEERQALEKERLQAAQEAQQAALDAEKEAVSERYEAEREAISATTAHKEEEVRKQFEATQKGLDMAMAALMADIPVGVAAREDWIKRVEAKYAQHGVYLDKDFAPKVTKGMGEAMTNSLDIASNEMMSNRNWTALGLNIGLQMREGTLKGYTAEQIAESLVFGTGIGDPAVAPAKKPNAGNTLSDFNNQFLPGPQAKATGGPIFGPGSGTSDSIPALLSNGEHVLTAKEVKAAGGHKAIERLREAIKSGTIGRFAVGGAVGASTGAVAEEEVNLTVASTGAGTVADGGVMSALGTDVSNMGSMFDDTLTNTVAPAWQQFGDMMVKVKKDSIDPVLEGSKIALADYAAQTNQIMSANMNPAWVQFGQNLKMVKEGVFDVVMTDMKAGIQSLASTIGTSISNEMMPKWTEGANHVRTMQDTVIDPAMQQTQAATTATAQNFGTAADMIGVGWGRVKENAAAPVRYTIGTVFNDGLVGMWNSVADALDLDPMNRHEFSFATGGVLPGYTPGKDVHHFTSPTGGKLHLSGGEAIMRPEWTRAVGGPAAVEKMNAAARSGNMSFHDGGVIPGTMDSDGYYVPTSKDLRKNNTHADEAHAMGGVFGEQSFADGGSLTPLSTPYNKRLWEIVSKIAPGMSLGSTELWKPSGARRDPHHGTGHAIDVSDGGNQMPTPATMGVAKFFHDEYGKAMTELIHWPENGWTNLKNGSPLNYGAGTNSGHQNHVHLATHTVLPDTGGELPMFPVFGGGSAGGMDPKIMAAVETFNKKKDELKKNIETHISAGPDSIMKAIPGKMFTGISEGMQKKIREVMPMAGSVTLGAYGLDHMDHVKEIIAAAKERGLPKTAAKIAIGAALVESELRMYANTAVPESLSFAHEALGSDHDSVGLFQQRQAGWGTTAERMNARASAGMFYNKLVQVPGWQTMDPGAAAQAVQVSAFPAKYGPRMAEAEALIQSAGGWEAVGLGGASGDPVPASTTPEKKDRSDPKNWFDKGGVAAGTGVMEKGVISPERVLSPRQTQAFERLVPAMDRVALGGISEDQFMDKTKFDRNAAFQKMIERNSTAQIDFTGILEKMTPILTQLVGQLKSQVVPGITGYANDLIKLDTDAQRIDKVSEDVVNAITGMKIPEINTDMALNIGGNIYGDAALNATLEQWKQQIIREVQMQQAMAQQAIGGK